jgi:hypothetical protein
MAKSKTKQSLSSSMPSNLNTLSHPKGRLSSNLYTLSHPKGRLSSNLNTLSRPKGRLSSNLYTLSHPKGRLSSNLYTLSHPKGKPSVANRSMLSNSRLTRDSSRNAHSNSSMSSKAPGSSIARATGSPTIAPGSNAGATTVITFRTTVSEDTLAAITDSAFLAFPSWLWAGFHGSSTRAIGSVPLTHGRNTGGTIGTTPTMFMWFTPTAVITCMTAGIRAPELRSVSRCSNIYRPGAAIRREL